jgi:signal peptidase II
MAFEKYLKIFSLIFIFFAIVALDQISKLIAQIYLSGKTFFIASDFLVLKLYQNYNTILGVNLNFLIVCFFAVFFTLIFWIVFQKKINFSSAIPAQYFIFIIAGAAGNIIDRIRFGFVIDFISVSFFSNELIFNFADCAIVVGAVLIISKIFSNSKSMDNLNNL